MSGFFSDMQIELDQIKLNFETGRAATIAEYSPAVEAAKDELDELIREQKSLRAEMRTLLLAESVHAQTNSVRLQKLSVAIPKKRVEVAKAQSALAYALIPLNTTALQKRCSELAWSAGVRAEEMARLLASGAQQFRIDCSNFMAAAASNNGITVGDVVAAQAALEAVLLEQGGAVAAPSPVKFPAKATLTFVGPAKALR